MATFTYTVGTRQSEGSEFKVPVQAVWSSSTYSTGGESITAAKLGLNVITDVSIEDSAGYIFDAIIASGGASFLLKAYQGGSGTSGATTGGTPAGSIGAGSSHTHTLTLAASAAGSAHTHSATPGGTIDNESAHTHGVLLDAGASAAGDAHTHSFTGTAISADTFTMTHDATPETSVLYINTFDFIKGFFSSDCSAENASDYFTTAGGAKCPCIDDNGSAVVATFGRFQVYYNAAAAAGERLCCNNTITASDLYVNLSNNTIIKVKHDAGAAGYVAAYFNDDAADKSLALNGTLGGAASITDNAVSTAYRPMGIVAAGSNANESTHTHGPGTLADTASAAGSAHSHGITGLTVSNANESAHTHALTGTTVDAEAAHTHTFTGSALATHTHTISATAFTEYSGSLTATIDLVVYGY